MRLPARLPSRPSGSVVIASTRGAASAEDEDNEEEGTWDRSFVKTASMNSLKSELKRAAKINRTDSKKISMNATN